MDTAGAPSRYVRPPALQLELPSTPPVYNSNSTSMTTGFDDRGSPQGGSEQVEVMTPQSALIKLPFSCILFTVMMVSTFASVFGAVIIYLQSLESLKSTVNEISGAETLILSDRISLSFSNPVRYIEGMKKFLYYSEAAQTAKSASELLAHERWIDFLAITGINNVQESGVVLLPQEYPSRELMYSHTWHEISNETGTPTKEFIFAHYEPGMEFSDGTATDGEIFINASISSLDPETGHISNESHYDSFNIKAYGEHTQSWPQFEYGKPLFSWETRPVIAYKNRERWRPPQIWFSSDGTPYQFTSFETVHEPPAYPHPWWNYTAIMLQGYFVFNFQFDGVFDEDTNVYVYDRHHGHIYTTNTGREVVIRGCFDGLRNTHSLRKVDTCLAKVDTWRDNYGAALAGAVAHIGEEDTLFLEAKLDGTDFFVRYRTVYRSVTDGVPSVDLIIIWLRPVSSVDREVNKALITMLIFSGAVLIVDIILAFMEYFIIGRPLANLSRATKAMASLDVETAKAEMLSNSCDFNFVGLREVDALTRSFNRTLRFLTEYLTFMPQGLTGQTPEVDHICSDSPPSPEAVDARKIERLREVGLKSKFGTVLQVKLDLRGDNIDSDRISWFVKLVLMSVKKKGGIILRLSPLECVATWNIHNASNQHARDACSCAIDIKSKSLGRCYSVIATGQIYAGSVGDHQSRAVAAAGDILDICSGALPLAVYLRVGVLMSAETYDMVRATIGARVVDKILLPSQAGQDRTVLLYEVKTGDESTDIGLTLYNKAWSRFCQGDFTQASEILSDDSLSGDRQALRLLSLSRYWSQVDGGFSYLRKSRMPWDDFECQLPEDEKPATFDSVSVDVQSEVTSQNEGSELVLEIEKNRKLQLLNPLSDFGKPPANNFSNSDCSSAFQESGTLNLGNFSSIDVSLPPTIVSMGKEKQTWFTSNNMLGKGSYGKVFSGMTPDGDLIALKAIKLNKNLTEEEIRDLVNEVSLLSQFRHPNIVGYNGSAVASDVIVISMEYMPGGSLAHILASFGRLSVSVVKRYSKDMLKGLSYLHENDIIHRDLKPGNVLVAGDGVCKLADFGSCGHVKSSTDTLVGTAMYMPPEVIKKDTGLHSDIWSFGISFGELITGSIIYDVDMSGILPVQFIYMLMHGKRPTIPTDIPEDAQAILTGSLHEDPSQRMTAGNLLESAFYL
eukprot:TRINITY_DN11926_c0_g4_i2.p1 TRINITY_DN11926_c0_g4~~TRINITY_DN11926_c0_g4_i2.p1  ORF type:complete len:1203 (+),score=164.10 TRINITY_DN11926_c0_g4_i2:53-3610(+)